MTIDAQRIVISLIAVAIILVVSFPVHEFAHALAAFRLGDSTARYLGRLSLDPRRHFDPLGAGLLAVSALVGGIFIGWAKPTPVNPTNLDGGRRGEALVALAGPVSNLILAALVAIPVRLVGSSEGLLQSVGENRIATLAYDVSWFFVFINVFLFMFNLLPIPPLDGWKVLLGVVDARTAFTLRQLEQYAFLAIVFILLFGGRVIGPIGNAIMRFLVGDAPVLFPVI